MAKINRKNACERISEMLAGYEIRKTDKGDKYFEMTEAEFDAIVANVLNASVKELSYHIERYTIKYNIAWLGNAYGGRLSTYTTDFAFVKFI